MDFGMFMEFQTRPETSPAEAFDEGFDLVDASATVVIPVDHAVRAGLPSGPAHEVLLER